MCVLVCVEDANRNRRQGLIFFWVILDIDYAISQHHDQIIVIPFGRELGCFM